MRGAMMAVLAAGIAVCVQPARSDSLTVANYQGGPDHAGHYVVPGLTWASAPSAHPTPGFKGSLRGEALAQPLYWHPTGAAHGLIVAATTGDFVQALDPVTGSTVWTTSLGTAVPGAQAECQGKKPRPARHST